MYIMRNKKLTWALIVCLCLLSLPLQTVLGADVATERLAGGDRYQTAVSIAQAGWTTAENAVLAAGSDANLVDALTVAPLAKLLGAPILLTENGRLTAVTSAELQRLGVKTVYTSSGGGVITQPVQDAVRALGISIVPLGGADRFETAANIAAEIAKRTTVTTVVVTTAYSNADALSVASIAAKNGWPILLTPAGALPASVTAFISAHSVAATYVIGGTGVVGAGVFSALPGATRLGGADRYETNAIVLQQFADSWDYAKGLFIANGTNSHLVDALTASAYIAGAPLLLTDNSVVSAAAKAFLAGKNIARVVGLGGVTVTSETILSQIVAAIAPPVVTGGGGSTGGGAKNYDNGPNNLTINVNGSYYIGDSKYGTAAATDAASFFGVGNVNKLKSDSYTSLTIGNIGSAGKVGVAGIDVTGDTIINGGGPNSVFLYDIIAKVIKVNSPANYGTSLKLGGTTHIEQIEVNTYASVYTPEADTSGIQIDAIYVNNPDTSFTLGAPVTTLEVTAPANGKVENITFSIHGAPASIVIDTKNIANALVAPPTLYVVLDDAYVIDYIVKNGGDEASMRLAVAGTLNSIVTATDPALTVNVEVIKAPAENPNDRYLQMAKGLIEGGTYEIPVANQVDQNAKTAWVRSEVVSRIALGTTDANVQATDPTVSFVSGQYTVALTNQADTSKPEATGSAVITVTEEDASSVSTSVSQSIAASVSESVSVSQSTADSASESEYSEYSYSHSVLLSDSQYSYASVSASESTSQSTVNSASESVYSSDSESSYSDSESRYPSESTSTSESASSYSDSESSYSDSESSYSDSESSDSDSDSESRYPSESEYSYSEASHSQSQWDYEN
jgi:putative cell wall-binding protein